MLIIHDKNSIDKKSVKALLEISKQEMITPLMVIKFYDEYGILIPSRQEVEKLKKSFGLL
jgi:hypothetical protein